MGMRLFAALPRLRMGPFHDVCSCLFQPNLLSALVSQFLDRIPLQQLSHDETHHRKTLVVPVLVSTFDMRKLLSGR